MNNDVFKVFILEDMEPDLALTKRQVRKYNPAVLFASARNRTEFEAKLIDFQPDIVLSDYNLPDMNGLEALLYVREHLDSTPFIFITGILNDEEKVADTILSGASGYLLKENIKNLPELLGNVIERSREILRRREREWERNRNNQLLLQKSIATLRDSGLANKDALITALQEVADNLP
ncbi:MAG: response regulator [Bacteroidota bacterium]